MIGDNCVLFSGAKVIGGVSIGSYCVVGAGAVVTKDVPDCGVVGGVPAKLISNKGDEISNLYVVYSKHDQICLFRSPRR